MAIIINFFDYHKGETVMTFAEVCERLKEVDEIALMEVLEISSEDLVDRFEDKIELKIEGIQNDFKEY